MGWAFLGMIRRPSRTLAGDGVDARIARRGMLVLLGVSFVYTLILLVFLWRGYPAASRSVLGLPVEEQYRWQIWYQGPLFFGTTAWAALLLAAISRGAGKRDGFAVAFGRMCLATAVPFAGTTMLVESGLAVLLAAGVLSPEPALRWLTGAGAWFATLYQSAGLIWLLAWVVLAVKASGVRRWTTSAALGLLLVVAYGLPVALLIR